MNSITHLIPHLTLRHVAVNGVIQTQGSWVMGKEQQWGFSEWEHDALWPRDGLSPSLQPGAGRLGECEPVGIVWLACQPKQIHQKLERDENVWVQRTSGLTCRMGANMQYSALRCQLEWNRSITSEINGWKCASWKFTVPLDDCGGERYTLSPAYCAEIITQ